MCVSFFPFLHPPLILEMQGEPYRFSHLLFISRAYHLSEEEEALLAHPSTRRQPKSKKMRPATSQQQQARPRDGVYSFHPEDDLISQVSSSLSTFFLKKKTLTLTLLKGIVAHADVHLYDTCTDGEGKGGVWVGCAGTDDAGSAC